MKFEIQPLPIKQLAAIKGGENTLDNDVEMYFNLD